MLIYAKCKFILDDDITVDKFYLPSQKIAFAKRVVAKNTYSKLNKVFVHGSENKCKLEVVRLIKLYSSIRQIPLRRMNKKLRGLFYYK